MNEIKLVLKGNIVSNKNSLVARLSNSIITTIRKFSYKDLHDKSKTNSIIRKLVKHCQVTHTKKYKEWYQDAMAQIMDQVDYEPFLEKVHIDYTIYFPKKGIAGGDGNSKEASISDVLSSCNIIDDDNYDVITSYSVTCVYRKGDGGAEIFIKKIK